MRWSLSLLVCVAIATASAGELPAGIERVLSGHAISPDEVSILVEPLDSREPILSHEADVPRNPASVMKLVTTWTGLEVLGPAYVWPTEVYFLGSFDGHSLHGDLAIKGYGDPFLVVEEVWKMLRVLRQTGLEEIQGDLLLDDSYFSVPAEDPGAFDGQPYRTYNVIPNALLANFKAVRFQFVADPINNRVNIATDPVLGNLDIRNRLQLVDGPCRGYQAGISFNVADAPANDRVIFEGRFPRSCNSYSFARTVLNHDTYLFGLFESLWEELGGHIHGELRHGTVPEDSKLVLTWRSPPLGDVIRSINKNSNNVMTRQLLYTLGAEKLGPPGTQEKGEQVVRELLAARGIDASSLVLSNGAGLARESRVSVRLLADLLHGAARSAYASEFISSLSLAGQDGTTRGRFDDDEGNGKMHVKTGRLDHVSALAGIVHGDDDRNYIVAIIMNSEDAHLGPGKELEEAVMQWFYTRH